MKRKTVMCWRCLDIHAPDQRRMIKVNGQDRNACPKCKSAVFVLCD
jgi:hypothetical protein